jgi:hypothetical protein
MGFSATGNQHFPIPITKVGRRILRPRRLIFVCLSSGLVLRRAFVKDHPGSAKFVAKHAKTESEKCLLDRDKERIVRRREVEHESVRPPRYWSPQGKIGAAHRLEPLRRNVGTHKLRISNHNAGMKDSLPPIRRHVAGIRGCWPWVIIIAIFPPRCRS